MIQKGLVVGVRWLKDYWKNWEILFGSIVALDLH